MSFTASKPSGFKVLYTNTEAQTNDKLDQLDAIRPGQVEFFRKNKTNKTTEFLLVT